MQPKAPQLTAQQALQQLRTWAQTELDAVGQQRRTAAMNGENFPAALSAPYEHVLELLNRVR